MNITPPTPEDILIQDIILGRHPQYRWRLTGVEQQSESGDWLPVPVDGLPAELHLRDERLARKIHTRLEEYAQKNSLSILPLVPHGEKFIIAVMQEILGGLRSEVAQSRRV